MTRAHLSLGETVATCDPVWIKLSALPLLADHPARCDALRGHAVAFSSGASRFTMFPVATDGIAVGVVELETPAELDAGAHHAVLSVLHVYRNFESLLDYSERDTLTGLLNRKTFDETFLKIIASEPGVVTESAGERRAADPQGRYFVGMIDIDFFKSVNDRYGHLIGDEVLLLQSRLMRSTFRYNDRLYRFGGEEFVVLMRCGSSAGAARAFERLRSTTQDHLFPQAGQITVSTGFSEVRAGDSPTAALGRADQAVYYAKEHGRNQVHSYDDLVACGRIEDQSDRTGEIDLF